VRTLRCQILHIQRDCSAEIDARVPAPGGVQREAAVGDVVRGCAVPSARHGYVLAMPSAEADAAQHQHCAATALDDNGCFLG
jgi:hypothetical protein